MKTVSLTLKNIPPDLHGKLKARARRNGRSLNAEAIRCLTAAVDTDLPDAEEIIAEARQMHRLVRGRISAEEIDRIIEEGRR